MSAIYVIVYLPEIEPMRYYSQWLSSNVALSLICLRGVAHQGQARVSLVKSSRVPLKPHQDNTLFRQLEPPVVVVPHYVQLPALRFTFVKIKRIQ